MYLFQDVGFVRIDGRTTAENRTRLSSRFQADSQVRVAILSINAANAGLNLTSANVVVFAELYWNPGVSCAHFQHCYKLKRISALLCCCVGRS